MAEWYYAHNQQQQGPVTWAKLRDLAVSGGLDRDDMVWREGMREWQKAMSVEGLFAGVARTTAAVATAETVARSRVGAEAGVRERDTGPRDSRDRDSRDRADPDNDTPRRRKKKKKEEGMSPGALAGLIGGCVAGGLVVLIIIIVLLVRTGNNRVANQPPPALPVANVGGAAAVQANTYEITLAEGQENMRSFQFQQGQNVTINVTTRGGFIDRPDVDLYVSRAGAPNFLVFDDSLSEHCFVNFVAPATDQYTLRVDNLGPGNATCTVNIR